MVNSLRHSTVAAAVAACSGALCLPAMAQSLSLSYKLDPVNAPATAKTPAIVGRCSGLSWAASLAAACFVDAGASAAVAAAPPPSPAAAAPEANEAAVSPRRPDVADTYSAADTPTPSSFELPLLGSPPRDARLLRAAGGRDSYIGNARPVDLNFRFGSKYRMRSGEEGWEVYKFSDVTSENRTQSGMKNLGVELLFPFQ
jgi:hypothetical protein